MMRSYVLSSDTAHYDAVIRRLEARGLRVIPGFAGGLDGRPVIDTYFRTEAGARIDAMVSLTGFSLVGGPAYNDNAAAIKVLASLDIPYVAAHPLEFQTLGQWADSTQGLGPIETTMLVALPELDGATNPTVFGGRHGSDGCRGCAQMCSGAPQSRRWRPASSASTASRKRSCGWQACAARGTRRRRSGSCCSAFPRTPERWARRRI